MDSSWAVHDGAKDNSLGYRLSPEEAARLRPLPKWMFIKPRLPQIEGNSVLELGSNCGFFSFEFAKMGALHVTGIEAICEYLERSEAARSHLGFSNVKFVQMDWCNDPPIEQHDIVFSSEVVGHLVFPFLGLYRLLAAARKYLVLDLGVHWAEKPTAHFDLMLGYTRYHAFSMSDSLLTEYFVRCGVPRESIHKHPYGGRRCLYIVDVTHADLRSTLISSDDPLWSGKFSFNFTKGATYLG
jgi:SAM-dependent methyltransferase